ncbi:hypothetical protein ACR744_09255 [Bifidobacterium pseudocatenulatum]
MAARRCAAPFPGPAAHGHGGAWSVVGIGSAARDADLPLRLENASVRMAVDRLHALGIPLTVMYTEIEA